MKRRQLLAGLGTAIAGSGLALGTGAFTSVEASRSVDVNVAKEDQAYLAISPSDGDSNSAFAFQASGDGTNELSLDFNSVKGSVGEGVGKSSDYEFDDVFVVENQGTQDVDLYIGQLTDSDFEGKNGSPNDTLELKFYPGSQSSGPLTAPDASSSNSVTINTGNSQKIGVKINLGDVSIDDWAADATIEAEAN